MVTRTVREALVTRSVSEEDPLIAGRADERWGVYGSSLVDTSGYHFLGLRPVPKLVTQSVSK